MAKKAQNFSNLEYLFQQVDIKAKLESALADILKTDFRQDQFRTVKIFLLYQAGILDDIEARLKETVDLLGEVVKRMEALPTKGRDVKKFKPVMMK